MNMAPVLILSMSIFLFPLYHLGTKRLILLISSILLLGFVAILGNTFITPLSFLFMASGSALFALFDARTQLNNWTAVLVVFFILGLLSLLFSLPLFLALVGSIAGYAVMRIFSYIDAITGFFSLLETHGHADKEVLRQWLHFFFGLLLSAGAYFQLLSSDLLFLVLVVGGILAFQVRQGKVSGLRRFLSYIERDHHLEAFPGRGAFYFVLSAWILTLIAPAHIASASLLILAIGDSSTNIIGKYYGHIRLPYNPKKHIEGPLWGAFLASLGTLIFVPWPQALIASLLAMFVETLPLSLRGFELDDNVTIPLTACFVLLLLPLL